MNTTKSLAVSHAVEDILLNQEVHRVPAVTPRHTLKEALRLSPVIDAILANQELQRAQSQLAKGKQILDQLWGCEVSMKSKVDAECTKLEVKQRELQLDANYPQKLNMDVLKWRTPEGWPALGLFTTDEETLTFSSTVSHDRHGNREPLYPKGRRGGMSYTNNHLCNPDMFGKYYEDVLDRVEKMAMKSSYERMGLACSFSGLIPMDVKAIINKAVATKLFDIDNIFLLAETPKWSTTKVKTIKIDPIVVGWDGKDLRVITVFDTTSLEELALNS
jgi:hypothetical protein